MSTATDQEIAIRHKVMAKLGQVPNLLRVEIKPTYGRNYRVNVYVSGDKSEEGIVQTSRIKDSFVYKD